MSDTKGRGNCLFNEGGHCVYPGLYDEQPRTFCTNYPCCDRYKTCKKKMDPQVAKMLLNSRWGLASATKDPWAGKTFREIDFTIAQKLGNSIGLSVFVDDKELIQGYFGEVLKNHPELGDFEVVGTSYYFNVFVVRLRSPKGV